MRSPLGLFANDAENRIPFVVVEDLADVIVRAVSSDVAVGKVYNVAGRVQISKGRLFSYFSAAGLRPRQRSKSTQILIDAGTAAVRVADHLERFGGKCDRSLVSRMAVTLLERHARRRYQEDYVLDCSRAARDLGWQGEADYREAVCRTMEWYRQHTGRSESRDSVTA